MEAIVKFIAIPGMGLGNIKTDLDIHELRSAIEDVVEVTGPLEPGRNAFIEHYDKTAGFDRPSETSAKALHGRIGQRDLLFTYPGHSFALGSSKLEGWIEIKDGVTEMTLMPEAVIRLVAEFLFWGLSVCAIAVCLLARDTPKGPVIVGLLFAVIATATLLAMRRKRNFEEVMRMLIESVRRAEERPRPARSSRAKAAS